VGGTTCVKVGVVLAQDQLKFVMFDPVDWSVGLV